MDNHEVDKVLLGMDGNFGINVDAGEVFLCDVDAQKKQLNVGTAFIYVVE